MSKTGATHRKGQNAFPTCFALEPFQNGDCILSVTDYYTKWVEAKPLRDNTAASTTKILYKNIWCRFGCPIELVSDQGTHFINKIVHELSTYYAMVHKKSTPYYPQANGLA